MERCGLLCSNMLLNVRKVGSCDNRYPAVRLPVHRRAQEDVSRLGHRSVSAEMPLHLLSLGKTVNSQTGKGLL